MACDPSTLLADAAPYRGMDEGVIRTARLALLSKWLLELNPSADVTPATLTALATRNYGGLSEGSVKLVKLQLLCQISQI